MEHDMVNDPTFIGTVQDVQGTTISVQLTDDTITGLTFVAGEGYRIGQVGSFVKIPLGYMNLYGLVSQVGAGAAPRPGSQSGSSNETTLALENDSVYGGNRWLQIQLVGEGAKSGRFQRGISQYPTIDDRVHIVTEADLKSIYGPGDPTDFVPVGYLASAESIPALVDINKLLTRHSAVVGATGAGKSTTVAGLLLALSSPDQYPSARIIVLDIHGEYAKALTDRSAIFRIGADRNKGEQELHVPFWALNFDEMVSLFFDELDGQKASNVADAVLNLKRETLVKYPRSGVSKETATVDSPIPFCLHKLWLDLFTKEIMTVVPKPGGTAEEREPAFVLGQDGKPVQPGDAMTVTPPLFRNVKTTGPPSERVQYASEGIGIRQQLAGLASRLRDPRFSFLFRPGDWLPDESGAITRDLDDLIQDWVGNTKPITILDLSGVPSSVMNPLIGALLRTLYDALFWARNLPEGGRERPLLIVLEEAHTYLDKELAGSAAMAVRRIAKEGRKYGVGIMIVSQRPSEVDPTILSQCGTIFAMRLTNDTDRGQIKNAASENLKGLFDMLPILRTGEAIIVGEGVSLPVRTIIEPPERDRRPDSMDPRVVVRGSLLEDGFSGPGGWNQRRDKPDYSEVMKMWRKQNARYEHPSLSKPNEEEDMENNQ